MATNYWKSKVLPKIKKVFEKNSGKKVAAAEACKSFDEAKEQYSKEVEEKKTELHPKVTEIYEAASVEIKGLVKEPKDSGLKKQSAAVQKFLDELAKIEFPGSKVVSEAASKFGPAYVSGPVVFVFEKVSTFIVETKTEEEKKDDEPAAEPAATCEEASDAAKVEEVVIKEKEIVVEEEKKETAPEVPPPEVPAEAIPEKKDEAPAAAAAEPAAEAPKA